jgi:tetratricopeptide (TPR) repeat protein
MIKALVIGLGLALSFDVASAQAKKPARKKAAAPKKADPKADPPAPTPAPAADATPPAAPAPAPAAQTPAAKPVLAPAPSSADPTGNTTMPKTTEKAGTQLDRRGSGDYRDVTEANEKAASAAFLEGNAQLNDGFFVKAVERYKEALKRWDHPAIHYNLALALINLDQPIEVYEQLNKALQYGPEPLEKDKYDHGKEYLRLVEGQLADIEVSCDKIGAKVSVDGKEVFVAPGKYTAKVRVGKHTFYADKEGYNARITAPFVGPGEKFRIELKLYTAEELTRFRRKWDRAWVPYVVMGVGVTAGAVGGLFQASAQSDYDDYNAKVAACRQQTGGCSTNAASNPDIQNIQSVKDSGDSKRLVGYIGYGIAGAALATGVVLAWMNREQPYQITAEDLQQQSPVSVAPIVSPEVVGAMVQGHF